MPFALIITENVFAVADWYWEMGTPGIEITATNNYFISAGAWHGNGSNVVLDASSNIGGNFFYDTDPYDGPGATGGDTVSASSTGIAPEYCVNIKQLTDSTRFCVPEAGVFYP